MIIDSHLHVWSGDFERFPFAAGRRETEPAPVELLNEEMAAAGVDRAVIVQPIHYLYDNRYVADCLRRFPGRFAAIGLLDHKAPDAPDRLERLVCEDGFSGLRIHLTSRVEAPAAWAAPDQDPLWQRAQALGASFCIHGPAADLAAVAPIIARFPGVRVALDHQGGVPATGDEGGRLLDEVAALARHGNVYIKLSPQPQRSSQPYPHRDTFDLYRRLLAAYGPRRAMWGTNFPGVLRQTGYAQALALFQRHLDGVSDEDRPWLLGGTAADLYGLAAP